MRKHCNQYRCKHNKDIGAYMIGFLYLMILIFFLHDINLFYIRQAQAQNEVIISPVATGSAQLRGAEKKVSAPAEMTREEKLKTYLEEKDSPLAIYASYIVDQADKHDIPWTLVVSISGKESSFGKHLAGDFNAWGITTGRKSPRFASFSSWKEAISFEANLLDKNYRENINRGIQVKYCPDSECSDTWVENVTDFQKEINSL